MSDKTTLLDVLSETLTAMSNIAFVVQLTVCLWIVILSTITKAIIYRQNVVTKLRALRDTLLHAYSIVSVS